MGDLGQTRVFGQSSRQVIAVGLRKRPLADLYHRLVTGSWLRLCVVYALAYLVTSTLFSAAHFALADAGVAPRGTVVGALVALARGTPFSEVRATLAPRALAAGALEGVEGFVWWAELVIGAGIVLAKFALLKARILFSRDAVVAPLPAGGEALLFRMANERTSHVVDAKVSVMLVRNEPDEDGEIVRRAHDLPLARGGTALFQHAWTAVHPIVRESPLLRQTAASLEAAEAEVIVTFSGYDEALTRMIYARHVYPAARVRFGARFRDIVTVLPDGTRQVDYRRFHDVVEAEPTRAERTPRKVREG